MPKVILASQSKYRAEQLRDYGLTFEQLKPLVDEEQLKSQFVSLSPQELCIQLAKEKTLSIALSNPQSVVIGSDQLVAFNNQILGKPGNRQNNVEQLKAMSGKTHELLTSLHVCYQNMEARDLVSAKIKLRELSIEEIAKYVDHDKPFDCAGGYKIEGRGITLMESIDTSDFTSIKGLPLLSLYRCFKDLGVKL